MAQSKLITRRKKATILVSKRTVEDAVGRANSLAGAWMEENQNDPRINELQNIVDHLSSILTKSPQDMRAEGAMSVEDYFDDAKMGDQAQTIKREVNMIAKWHDEQRGKAAPAPAQQETGVGYVPDSAVSKGGIKASDKKKADGGAAFVTDRDEKGEPKAPEKEGVPRLAKKQKKEAEDPAAATAPVPEAAPAPMPAPAPVPDGGKVNAIDYIPTETLIKVIGDLPKEEDFPQNKGKQDAVIELTNILKSRPIEPPEPAEGAAPAPAAAPAPPVAEAPAVPAPVVASGKKADEATANPHPEEAKIDLGGLEIAAAEKTAVDYRLHDFKLQDEGVVPTGMLPSADEQANRMHPEEEEEGELMEASMEKEAVSPPGWGGTTEAMKEHKDIDNPFALSWYMKNKGDTPHYKESGDEPDSVPRRMAALEVWKQRQASMYRELASKYASGNGGGAWFTDIGEKGKVTEDGGRTPEIGEAHAQLDESPARLERPVTTAPIKLAADMSAGRALKESERFGNELKKMYLDAKSLTQVNDTRPVREAVEAIFRAADMFDEATKTLNKQDQQEKNEAEAAEIKAKNKKSSSLGGLALAASE
jgi:hypothetical protein